ncbi:hypothetical protein SJAV_00570 [Sulfurisphaera javensis]|uniref:Uncharacterized protein n=1 Tax=Sulfurisphaera javensis TaxID=2049879 RepID=A0AAT9GN17_9CREN
MVYECCDQKFESEKEFKKHIKSKCWHRISYSITLKVNVNRDELFNIIKNPKLIFGLCNIITPIGDNAILYLPLKKIKYGTTLKRSIIGKIEGPKLNVDMLEYKFISNKLIYDFSFRIKRINENQSELTILSSMSINIGLLGRLLPSEVIKALKNIVTPQIILNDYITNNLKSL